jgi:hypothetical protein
MDPVDKETKSNVPSSKRTRASTRMNQSTLPVKSESAALSEPVGPVLGGDEVPEKIDVVTGEEVIVERDSGCCGASDSASDKENTSLSKPENEIELEQPSVASATSEEGIESESEESEHGSSGSSTPIPEGQV